MPHIYANQIEWCCNHLKYRDSVILSTAPAQRPRLRRGRRRAGRAGRRRAHRGHASSATASAPATWTPSPWRMNMYSHGVDPHLDFSDMPEICEIYERVTRMHVYERTPYAGALVFAAFSGSHQDAIAKGMTWRKEKKLHAAGPAPTSPSTRTISAVPTMPTSSASTARAARAASASCCSRTTAITRRRRCARIWATASRMSATTNTAN